jgi:pyruvate dehydrogenase E2 component (dihydrolipoamide acetyltransferase)
LVSEVVMPKMGYDMEEGKIIKWIKQEGDWVEKGEVIAEIETGKVNIEIEAFDSGVLRKIIAAPGETVPVGQVIAIIAGPDEELPEIPTDGKAVVAEAPPEERERVAAEAPPEEAEAFPPVKGVKASPLARRLAEEHGIDITQVRGTGPGGRITRDDVKAYIEALKRVPPRPPVPERVEVPMPEQLPEVPAERVALSQLRKTVARRMVQSKQQAPHFYVTMAIDMSKAMELRRQINEYAEEAENIKVSVNDLVIKAVAQVLRRFPQVNASFAGDELVVYQQINVGMAVATEDGLLTLVIPNTDQKSLLQIARETADKATRAREGKLRAEDFQVDGTFTVSNLGMYGVEEFVAIINPPEAAILAVGAVQQTPVVRDGEIVVAPVMRVTLSADHRVIDGAVAAEFLAELKRVLENPMALLA